MRRGVRPVTEGGSSGAGSLATALPRFLAGAGGPCARQHGYYLPEHLQLRCPTKCGRTAVVRDRVASLLSLKTCPKLVEQFSGLGKSVHRGAKSLGHVEDKAVQAGRIVTQG